MRAHDEALSKLQGLALTRVNRAAMMLMFWFGDERVVPDTHRGGERTVPDFALHVQCAWRLCRHGRILIGSQDVLYDADTPWDQPNPEGFEWDVAGANRCDRFFAAFPPAESSVPLIVATVSTDELGGFRLGLSGGFSLQCFPDAGTPDEIWRLLQPGRQTDHYVAEGTGDGRYGSA